YSASVHFQFTRRRSMISRRSIVSSVERHVAPARPDCQPSSRVDRSGIPWYWQDRRIPMQDERRVSMDDWSEEERARIVAKRVKAAEDANIRESKATAAGVMSGVASDIAFNT